MPPNSKYRSHSSPCESPASCLNVSSSSVARSITSLFPPPGCRLPRGVCERLGPTEEGHPASYRLTQKVGEGIVLIEVLAFHDDSLGCRDDLSTLQGLLKAMSQLRVGHTGMS